MNNVPTLFAGFRLFPEDLSDRCFVPWPSVMYADRYSSSHDEKKIKKEMRGPGHAIQYASARTGQLVAEKDQDHRDIDAKAAHQRKGKPKPDPTGGIYDEPSDRQYFQSRDRIDQYIGEAFRKWLEVKLRTEELGIGQFADGCISEQQHQGRRDHQ